MDVTQIVESNDTDTSDSDIFIVKQIKPVSRITLQQALIIKHSVLNAAKSKNLVKSKNFKNNVTDKNINKKQNECLHQQNGFSKKSNKNLGRKSSNKIENSDTNMVQGKGEVNLPKKVKRSSSGEIKQDIGICVNKTTPSKITDYFPGHFSEEPDKNIELSPDILRRRKKFKISDGSAKSSLCRSPVKKYLAKAFKELREDNTSCCSTDKFKNVKINIQFEPFCEPEFEHNFTDILNSVEMLDKESFENNSELLSFLLKKIIYSEMKKQDKPESFISENGIKAEKLLLEDEEIILKKFLYLNKDCSNVFVRMLCRKKDWHRVSTLNLKDIKDCRKELNILYKGSFVDINIGEEDIRTQINLLSRPEIFQLCKKFNVFLKSGGPNKKQDLINSLLESSTRQKSILDMLSKTDSNSRLNLLKSELKCCLGPCVKLSKTTLSAFNKIILLFSFAHYSDEESKRFSNQLFMCLKVFKNMMKFPSYKLSPCVVFQTRADFEEYEKALMLQSSFEIAAVNKQFGEFIKVGEKAKIEFRRLLNDENYKERFLRLKPFLKKFNGGTIYAKILTNYCTSFKKQTNHKNIISVAELLLDQNIFLIKKRGEWYKILSKALENQREMNAASEVLIRGLNDPLVNEVQKLILQLRGQLILKRKSNGIANGKLRKALDSVCTIEVQEPPSIEIRGQAVELSEKGFKCVYVEQNENGKVYSSVEEKAISHYRLNGYTRGFHVEGFIVHSIFFLFFYDIIYELSPVGVFQSPYQQAPLDFYSPCFYLSRKDEIDSLFSEMLTWSDGEIETRLNHVYHKNFHTTCLITWTEGFTPDLLCEVLKCLTMPLFVSICRRLVTNFGAMRSGFPDLTLWNPVSKKFKLVEVKSPNDKLSPAQRIWLDFLRNIGIDCEVCNVKNVNAKKLKIY